MCPILKKISGAAMIAGLLGLVPAVFGIAIAIIDQSAWPMELLLWMVASAVVFGSAIIALAILEVGRVIEKEQPDS